MGDVHCLSLRELYRHVAHSLYLLWVISSLRGLVVVYRVPYATDFGWAQSFSSTDLYLLIVVTKFPLFSSRLEEASPRY